MSWQEELRHLDEERAAGRISAEQHRRRSDDLLASVSGGGATSPKSSPLRRTDAQPENPGTATTGPAERGEPEAGDTTPAPRPDPAEAVTRPAPIGGADPAAATRPNPVGQGTRPDAKPRGQAEQPPAKDGAQAQPNRGTRGQGKPAQAAGLYPIARPGSPPRQAPAEQRAGATEQGDAANRTTRPLPAVGQPAQQAQSPRTPQPQQPQQSQKPQQQPQQPRQDRPGPPTGQGGGGKPPARRRGTTGRPGKRPDALSLLHTDRPTTAPSPADQRVTDSIPYPRPMRAPADEPTVVRPAVLPPPPPLVPEAEQPPRTGGRDTREYETAAAGSEANGERSSGRKPTWLFLAVGVFLVLALIIGGAWWFATGNNSTPAQSTTIPAPTGPTREPTASTGPTGTTTPPVEDRVPDLPGTPSPDSSTMAVRKGVDLKLYSSQEAEVLTDGGVREVTWKGSAKGRTGYSVLLAESDGPQRAKETTSALAETLRKGGYAASPPPDGLSGVRTLHVRNSTVDAYNALYTSAGYTVRIAVTEAPAGDTAALAGEFERTLRSVLAALPPS